MRKSLLILFIFSISLLSLAEVHIPGGYVEGTWTRENSPYYIEGDIIVYGDYNEIETLTIEPGVQVIFTGHYTFYVDGILYAIGESENMIVFTVQDTTGFSNTDIPDGGWGGLFFSGGRNGARPITGSEIAYCHIEYGKAVGSYDENNGGAIFVANESYVEIHNCEIVNNFAADSGGGIYFESIWSNLSIYDNNISYNNARRGAGIAINSAEITLTDNIISYNEATATDAEEYGFGGGIYCVGYYYPEIEGGRIHHNTAVRGGGLFVSESEPTISSLIVEYNGADIGGGVYCDYYGSPTIEHCKIQNNGADEYGAGIYTDYECNVNLVNCLVIDNTASLNGGGLYTGGGHPVLRNVTFWNNSSVLRVGGAIYCAGANVEIRNGIFWNDYPEEFALVQGSIEATYSDIELATGVYPGEGNLNITPHFRNTDARNLRLAVFDETGSAKNPLVDAGDPNDDYSQEPMPNGHRINMGAYGNTEDATITIHFAGGNIDGEEHWTNEQMQIINQPLVIGAGAILNLDSGLMVNIDNSDVEFIIHGIVRAIGAEGDTIQISPNLLDTTRNISWPGITFADDADNSIIRNVVIENAVNGLDLNHTSSEVRHTRITYDVRAGRENSTGSGIKVASGSEATIDDTEVENYSKGIEVNDASPFITNTRVRNSPESTRDNEVGIEVNGESSPEIDSCNVENFPKGIKVENNQAGTTASPFITNTRVRNSPESTRQTEVGIELSGNGNIEATIENCLIEDYPYAIEYVGNGSLLRTTPTLTNNRLRNSPESTRDNTLVKGIYLENLSSVEIDSCSIEYYPTAIEFVNNARVTSHPVITNSRVRNSPESTRDEYVGMKFTGDIYAEVSENEFVNCDTALITLGTAANGDFNHNLIYMKDSSPIDVAFYAENSSDITFSENTVYNYDYGFYCQDVNGSLENNIIWNTANPIEKLGESTLSVNYNDVEGGYPSRNNLDEDPLFVDAAGENFQLQEDSPCIDAGNPASDVPENGGLRIDIGRYEYTGDVVVKSVDGGTVSFGKSKVKMEISSGSGIFTVTHHEGTHPFASQSVARYETINLDSGSPIINLTLYYEDSQLNGEDENDLKIWKYHNGSWTKLGVDARNTDENWVQVNGISEFSDFLLSDADTEGALPIVLSSFNATVIESKPTLSWTTQSEANNIGWNVYRNVTGETGTALQINSEIIPGAGTTNQETSYEFTDEMEVVPNHTYWYWLESINASSATTLYGPITLTIPDENEEQLPETTVLFGNYPNPFQFDEAKTVIKFAIQENDEKGILSIYNIKGQLVLRKEFNPGSYEYEWKAKEQASGIYFYKLQTDSYNAVRKMILLK